MWKISDKSNICMHTLKSNFVAHNITQEMLFLFLIVPWISIFGKAVTEGQGFPISTKSMSPG